MKQSPLTVITAILIAIASGSYLLVSGSRQAPPPPAAPPPPNSEMLADAAGLAVEANDVAYAEGINGYFARPEGTETYPGVVMIHEWWGLNDNIRDMARELAAEGYAVLAVDLFGTVATSSDQARAQVSSFDREKGVENLRAAVAYLRNAGAPEVASLGWCFGGGQSLQLALSGEPLAATVIYYGQLVTSTEQLAGITWPVLGIFGDQDQSIPVETVKAFDEALDSAGITNQIHVYPGVGHAFANPSGANYAPSETADAWEKTVAFLEQTLKSQR